MRICLINSLYGPPQRGGAEVIVDLIAHSLVASGHQVFIITTATESAIKKEQYNKQGEIGVFRLPSYNITTFANLSRLGPFLRLWWHIFDIFNWRQAAHLRRILKKIQPDFIWSHNHMGLGVMSWKQLAAYPATWFMSLHDVQYYDPSGLILWPDKVSFFYKVARAVYSRLMRYLLPLPDQLISPSQWLWDFYKTKKYWPAVPALVLRQPAPLDSKTVTDSLDFIWLFVGQLEPHKGVDFLLKLWSAYKPKAQAEEKLIIIGDGSLQDKVVSNSSCDDSIVYLGRQTNDIVNGYLRQGAALLMPTMCYENSPTIIAQAQSFGGAILASRLGGIPEMLVAKNQWALPPADLNAWLTTMVDLRNNNQLWRLTPTKKIIDASTYCAAVLAKLK
ncbi:MAG: glycosyltransferase [Candidatus Komeilibacteria bacterium]